MSDALTRKEEHDKLLLEKPEDATHEEAECPFCNDTSIEGGDTMTDTKTYTDDELSAAVKEAVAPVKKAAEASELKISDLTSELETLRAANEDAEIQDEVAKLQTELDKATLRADEAEARVNEIISWLDEQSVLDEVASYLADVKTERLTAISEVASFSDEYIENNIDRWVALSDEDFAALVEDWNAVAAASKASLKVEDSTDENSEVETDTAMSTTRTENASTESKASIVYGGLRNGADIRRL